MPKVARSPKPVGKRGETRESVRRMSANHLDPRTIAQGLGISVSAVHYHLKRIEADSVPADEGAA